MTPATHPSTFTAEGLTPGEMLRVVFRNGAWRDKQVTGRFMEVIDGEMLLDLRPVAGTTRLTCTVITAIYRTEATRPHRPELAPAETRVF